MNDQLVRIVLLDRERVKENIIEEKYNKIKLYNIKIKKKKSKIVC